MDLHVVLIGVIVFIVSALLIYLISVFGMKEKSYEEAIAEQKRRMEEEREKQRIDKKAEKEKKKGKKPPKEKPKEKPQPIEKEHKMVNLEIEAEIIEPIEQPELKQSKSSVKQRKQPKSILANKDEKPLVAKQTQEVIHHKPPPKDDLELKHEHEKHKDQRKVEKMKPESPKVVKSSPKVVEEEIVVERSAKLTSSAADGKSKKSKGVAEPSFDVQQLIMNVRSAPLADQDVQALIDILLNKQGGGASISSEWNKKSQKGDPIVLLRKQLEEKERALQEEQQLAMANSNKCKEIRQEFNHEKTRYASLERQYQEKIAAQTQEIQALHSRMQSTHEQHMIESSRIQAHVQQLERQVGDQGKLKQLTEENRILKETLEKTKAEAIPHAEFNSLRQKVSIMENELSSNVVKLNSAEKSRLAAQNSRDKLEAELKKLKDSESDNQNVWTKRLDEVNQQLRQSEAEKTSLSGKLKAAEKDCSSVKTRLQELEKALNGTDSNSKELEGKLKTAETAKKTIESSLKSAEKKLQETEQQKNTLQQELETLKKENAKLAEEAKLTKERPLGDGQEAPQKAKPNGDIHTEAANSAIEEYKKKVEEKEKEIKSLQTDYELQKKENTKLQEQAEAQKKKNNELREKNWKAMDALEKAEKSASDKISRFEKEHKDQSNAVIAESEKYDKAVLKRLFPDISISDALSHKDWMSNFEKQVSVHVKSLSQKDDESGAKVKELEGNNKNLQSQVEDLKKKVSESAKLESRLEVLENEKVTLKKQLEEANNSSLSQTKTAQNKIKDLEDKVKELERQNLESKSLTTQDAANDSKIKDLEESNKKLKEQVEDYLAVLKTTETKLQQLENSVEGEERKWQDKAEALQLQLTQSQEEIKMLKLEVEKNKNSEEALTELEFAYRCLEKSLNQITDEMKGKVLSLEGQLKISEDLCSQLQDQVKEAETRISSLQESLSQSQELSQASDNLRKQVEELQNQVDSEKKKSKDLASQVVRLNGIIKTGHDALQQEQELVKKLKEQIDLKEKNSGTNSSQTVSELKVKLAEKEKQLDKEITSNKQLSQRLASSPPNESGTSV